MRVLVCGVVLGQPMGGVRRHNAELLPRVAERLATGGRLAILEGREPLPFELPAHVERIRADVPLGPPSLRAIHEGRALRAALEKAAAEGRPFDLVHTAHLPVPLRLPAPLTVTLHDLRSVEPNAPGLARRLFGKKAIQLAAKVARAFFTVSEHVGEELGARFGVPPERRFVVPNAADHFMPLPRDARDDAPLLCLGHLEPRKNVELVVRALAGDPTLPRLVLAGRPKGDAGERVDALARELGVADRVERTGPFEDDELAALYARAACLVMPSRVEGFGIPVLEAQRARCPVAISNIPALVEVAGSETPSFDPDDAAACARAIRAALQTTEEELADAAARADRFRWDRSAEAWIEGWESALA